MGCRVCRARKVKCDGRPNGCRNCERLQLDCVGDNSTTTISSSSTASSSSSLTSPTTTTAASPSSPPSSLASLRKIRTYRSCTSCRLSKTKCNGDRPRCSRCAAKKLDCVYDGGSAPRWTRSLNQSVKKEGEDGEVAPEASPLGNGVPGESSARMGSSAEQTPVSAVTPGTAHAFSFESSDTLSWLLSPELPAPRHIRRLVEHYFANIHPIRCFAFVHKPSFMRQLDSGFHSDDDSALLHVICAHGAKFHALSLHQFDQVPSPALLRAAGNQWAKKAETILLSNYGKISVHRLMTAILLCDFRFRPGEYNQALMLSGLAIRMAQALKLNTEHSSDIMCTEGDSSSPSVASRESRRRLMWACYVLDAWTGSGPDQLTMLREGDIKIQLPCNERNFGLRIPSVTETLGVGHVLQFLPPAVVPPKPAGNMGIMAYYIRIVTLWKRIVKYINNNPDAGPAPWLPESEFASLDADMGLWRRELPDFVEYSPDTIYARLDSNQLGGLMLIHCTYHHNYLELYKISMPELFRPRATSGLSSFPPEHAELLQALQADCYFHARQIARLVAEAAEHGARLLSDSLLPFFLYDGSRVMLYYVARLLDPERVDAAERVGEAVQAVEANVELLRTMAPLFPISESFAVTVERWLHKVRQGSRDILGAARPSEDMTSIQEVEMSSYASTTPAKAVSEFALPPISSHRPSHTYPASERPFDHPSSLSRRTSWTPANESTAASNNSPYSRSGAAASWDHASAAQQLVGLSRRTTTPPGSTSSTAATTAAGAGVRRAVICEALDLDDLRSFLSWDMHGMMDLGDTVSVSGYETEGLGMSLSSEWASAV